MVNYILLMDYTINQKPFLRKLRWKKSVNILWVFAIRDSKRIELGVY